jgi:TatD DNase family protein
MADELGVDADEFAAQVSENTLGLYGPFGTDEREAWLEARRG